MDDNSHHYDDPRSLVVRLVQLNGDKELEDWSESTQLIQNKPLDITLLTYFQNYFENGVVLLDIEEADLQRITFRVAEQMVFDGLVEKLHIENVSDALLLAQHFSKEPLNSEEQISDAISFKETQTIDIPILSGPQDIGTCNVQLESNNHFAETALVMVANVDFIQQPAIAFVRLMKATYFPETKDFEFPVRFLFILLAPLKESVDYYEIGRCMCTALRDKEFRVKAYTANTKQELVMAIGNFSINGLVVPAHEKIQKNQNICEEEYKNLLNGNKYETKNSINSLTKTDRLWGGLINDITRRIPQYKSDIMDGLNQQIIAASIFLYFGVLSTAITFGGLMSSKTENLMGISETLLSTSLVGIVFHLLSSQPLIIIGGTGPLLLFDEALFQLCKFYDLDFLTVRIYIGLWLGLIAVTIAAFDGSVYLRLLTRFTQEIFASLISLIFMMEAIFKVVEVFKIHPIVAEYNDSCTSLQPIIGDLSDNITVQTSTNTTEVGNKSNTALFGAVLSVGTFVLAYCLRALRNSHLLDRNIRRSIGDFGVPIAISAFVCLSYFVPQIYTEKLIVPEGISPTNPNKRCWIIPFNDLPIWAPFISFVAAILVYVFIFMETQISELIIDSRGMKKGSGFHVDIVLICLMNVVCGFLGMPWQSGATIRSVTHVSAVTVISKSAVQSDKSQILIVKEQRVSGFIISVMVGLSVIIAPILRIIPVSVLYGVFFYMGIVSISGIQFLHRIRLLFTPAKYHGSQVYVKQVQTWKMHVFTTIQAIALCVLWLVKSSRYSLALPFVLVLMVPLRQIISSFFSTTEMAALDGSLPQVKVKDEPDFYQQTHLSA